MRSFEDLAKAPARGHPAGSTVYQLHRTFTPPRPDRDVHERILLVSPSTASAAAMEERYWVSCHMFFTTWACWLARHLWLAPWVPLSLELLDSSRRFHCSCASTDGSEHGAHRPLAYSSSPRCSHCPRS